MFGRVCRAGSGVLACLLLASLAAPGVAAPILGENQDQVIVAPPATPIIQPTELLPDATVIHFSVLPSPANPDRFETTIVVQQDGGRQICVNHTSPVIIVRSYRADDEPFDPDIPTPIEGQDSDDVGELAGFNNKKLFIRPRGKEDRFDLPDERFRAGRFEGQFRRDEAECDQELSAGDFACLDEVIRTTNCDLTRHASLVRDLRVMIALNSIPALAPAAGGQFSGFPGQGFGSPMFGRPAGPIGAAPAFSGSFSGPGADGLLLVPNVIGLPLPSAVSVIAASGFVLGSVRQQSNNASNILKGLIISTAHAQTVSGGTVVNQTPTGGTRQLPGIKINLLVQPGVGSAPVAVPEPSSFSIFLSGILIMGVAYSYFRRRLHPGLTQT